MLITVLASAALAATEPVESSDEEAAISAALDALEAGWLEGDFHATAERANEALQLIENSACPWREDAAIVGVMGGVTGFGHANLVSEGYSFWVASVVDAELAVLPADARRLASVFASRPGGSIDDDALFMRSPYRNQRPNQACADAQLSVELLSASPVEADHLYIAIEFREPPTRRAARVPERLLYAFPNAEGVRLWQSDLQNTRWYHAVGDRRVLLLDPCDGIQNVDLLIEEVCRDGASSEG